VTSDRTSTPTSTSSTGLPGYVSTRAGTDAGLVRLLELAGLDGVVLDER
jgi:hypothetical protein